LRQIGLQHCAQIAEHSEERENCRADIAPTSALGVGVHAMGNDAPSIVRSALPATVPALSKHHHWNSGYAHFAL